ncbi:hypothetical protein CHL79_09915 [Delftia acidovorans]|uniref:DUF7948 domain-containing protein n=1 Tax=Delftia acidovorans TaxID=80866 RepID=UPI000BC3454E|nr:hypothetical protein [Delftia acidovorans]ATH12708.1 hypothetical protein CHL79_09915 [Delftia acidovorans]
MSISNRNRPKASRQAATTFFTWQLVLLAHAGCATAALASPAPAQQLPRAMQSLAVPFEANAGQFDQGVAFMGKTFAGEVFVTRQGQIVYSLPGPVAKGVSSTGAQVRQPGWSLTETLAGAQPLTPAGGAAAEARIHRFKGSHSHQSLGYRSVQLGQAWPGVSVELAARGSNVEKLFHVAPHADAAQIQVRLDGARSLRLAEGGELIVATGHGEVAYTAPVAFQMVAGQRVAVPVKYALNAAGSGYGFALGSYDATLPLVIDPLLQSTYLGGAGDDRISTLAIDKATGDVLVGGVTHGSAFPGVAGGLQTAGHTDEDGFVARLSGDLKTLRHSAILGGKGPDSVFQLALDAVTGDVVVSGETQSPDFPATEGGRSPPWPDSTAATWRGCRQTWARCSKAPCWVAAPVTTSTHLPLTLSRATCWWAAIPSSPGSPVPLAGRSPWQAVRARTDSWRVFPATSGRCGRVPIWAARSEKACSPLPRTPTAMFWWEGSPLPLTSPQRQAAPGRRWMERATSMALWHACRATSGRCGKALTTAASKTTG